MTSSIWIKSGETPDRHKLCEYAARLVNPLAAAVGHLLNRHHFHLKKVPMIQMDYPRGLRVKVAGTPVATRDTASSNIAIHWRGYSLRTPSRNAAGTFGAGTVPFSGFVFVHAARDDMQRRRQICLASCVVSTAVEDAAEAQMETARPTPTTAPCLGHDRAESER